MRKLKLIIYCKLLITTPVLLAYPQSNLPQTVVQSAISQSSTNNSRTLTYNKIINFLEEVETDKLEKCSLAQLEQVNQFISFLAKEGVLSNDLDEEMLLEEDIKDLLNGQENPFEYAYNTGNYSEYMIVPAIFDELSTSNIINSGWISKKWKTTQKFVKKHKKAIIIGAVVIVATTAVIVAVAASSTASSASAAAGAIGAVASGSKSESNSSSLSDSGNKLESDRNSSPFPNNSQTPTPFHDTSIFKSAIDEQISSFKESLSRENFFQSGSNSQDLSLEETGRIVGPLFAHESFDYINSNLPNSPQYSRETYDFKINFSAPPESSNNPIKFGHHEIDKRFSTDFASFFNDSEHKTNITVLSYQIKGEKELSIGYYTQAIRDFDRAIDMNPTDPLPYLGRSEAYFKLEDYDHSLEDFNTFNQQVTLYSKSALSVPEFGLGFAKGLPKGMYESGHGLLLFLSDIVIHPVHTGKQVWSSFKLLRELACSKEWESLAEVLAPEVHQLVTQWDSLPPETRGELAGLAFGKYGADIIIPGALAKAVSNGITGAQELNAISRNLRIAERTFLMESVAGMESGAKITEVVQLEKRISGWLGEDTRFIRNKANDPVFLSKDGLRRVRFDFNNPHKDKVHLHIEQKIDGRWKDASSQHRIYP